MRQICYIGEIKDFSDKWLISFLEKHYHLIMIEPGSGKLFQFSEPDLVINRLYTSSINRYGEKNILEVINVIRELEHKNIPVINSSKGYLLDLDRQKQFKYFSSQNFSFAQISKIQPILAKKEDIRFPCVVKINPSGRNKTLPIVRNRKELSSLSTSIKQTRALVLQPLIKNPLCYRTEFVGKWYSTFTQAINFQKEQLKFSHINKITHTPLSNSFKERVLNIMDRIEVQAFSLEYFITKRRVIIVDFNLTSNYPRFFIEQTKDQLKNSWLNLIENKFNETL